MKYLLPEKIDDRDLPRFGVSRFRCKDCGDKPLRAVLMQVQNGLPKRLRYFVHRDKHLPGEISRLLAQALTEFYRRRDAAPKDAAPAQFHVLQRFGSRSVLRLAATCS